MDTLSNTVLSAFLMQFGRPATALGIAPGRLEFIGNHCDYNGGRVMGVSVDRQVAVAIAAREDQTIQMASPDHATVTVPDATQVKPLDGDEAWANYALGVLVMMREAGLHVATGFDLCVASDLPAGAGMSSSAAFELATAEALALLGDFPREAVALARLCRRAENDFVGMPCGILDQGVSAFGDANAIVEIDCHTEAFSRRPLPAGVRFHVFNTTKKHALVESAYADRARECHDAFTVLRARDAALPCLAHASPDDVEAARAELGENGYRRARHVTEENRRVLACGEALTAGDLDTVGRLLTASHHSSRDWFENSCEELDFLVAQLIQQPHVYGARLSGGGFGGAVMAMTSADFSTAQAEGIVAAYTEAFGLAPLWFETATGTGARAVDPLDGTTL